METNWVSPECPFEPVRQVAPGWWVGPRWHPAAREWVRRRSYFRPAMREPRGRPPCWRKRIAQQRSQQRAANYASSQEITRPLAFWQVHSNIPASNVQHRADASNGVEFVALRPVTLCQVQPQSDHLLRTFGDVAVGRLPPAVRRNRFLPPGIPCTNRNTFR